MVLLGLVVDVEVALPFQLGAVGEMVESVTHLVRLLRVFYLLSMDMSWWGAFGQKKSGCGVQML
jgi:hypothetical protein